MYYAVILVLSSHRGTDGSIILKWILNEWEVGAQTGLVWPMTGAGGDPCECSIERLGSTKCGKFL
jgi:hypothetical protein